MCTFRYVPEFSTSSFLFLGDGTPASSFQAAAAVGILAGNQLPFFRNLWLWHIHTDPRSRVAAGERATTGMKSKSDF